MTKSKLLEVKELKKYFKIEKGSADSKLEELQRESRDYLKAIYETWKPWNLTGAGE